MVGCCGACTGVHFASFRGRSSSQRKRATLQQRQKQLDEARHAQALLESKDTVSVALAQQPGMPKGDVRVMYNSKMGMAMCDGWVEPAPANKSYQLWLVPREGKPISAGMIEGGPINPWMVKLPQGMAARACDGTPEPAGGTPQPTGPMVLVGAITYRCVHKDFCSRGLPLR